MNIVTGLLIVLEILVSVLLTLVILVQPSKSGGGLGGALGGGGMSEQLFGARTGNVLTKATIALATIFLVNTIALAMIYSRDNELVLTEAPPAASISAPMPEEVDVQVAEPLEATTEAAPAE